MTPLSTQKVVAGQRLTQDVFAADGRLLLQRGAPIPSPAEAVRLRAQGFVKRWPDSRTSVFAGAGRLADRLGQMHDDLATRRPAGSYPRRVRNLALEVVEIGDIDPDASFASIHLDNRHAYLVVHSMMAALVCSRLALASGLLPAQRLSLVCAALTHDVGLLDMTDFINAREALTDAERRQVMRHVERGVQMLQAMGVADGSWLTAVAEHHEFLDGSGYGHTGGDALGLGSRILSLADAYSAMLRPRPYRDRLLARVALESLYRDGLARYDGRLIEKLIWDLGFYPPGSVLRLRSHELAVAIRTSPGLLDGPAVACFTDAAGSPLLHPVRRDANDPAFAVADVLDPSLTSRMGPQIEACWSA